MESHAPPQAEAEALTSLPLNPTLSEPNPTDNPTSSEPAPETHANLMDPLGRSLPATETAQSPCKQSAIPEHLPFVPAPPKCAKPLTALQELLAVVNSTLDDSPPQASVPEPQPPPQTLKPLDRLKQGVEMFKKLNHPKHKRKGPKLGLTKKKALRAQPIVPPPKQPSPEVEPKTPLPKQESAVEANERVSQGGGSSGRESSPEEKRSHKKKIPLINIGERILIYWPIDGVFYAGTIIEHVVPKHRYTILYEDNEVEVLDLSKEIWRPGTLDPKKDRTPGEGIHPAELGLPPAGEIPHYMPPRKRRRLEKAKFQQGSGKKKGMRRTGGVKTGGVGFEEERRASVQELGAVEALLGVAGNKYGENVGVRKGSPGGPIYIGLKRKRSKQSDRGTSPKVANGWSSLPGALQPSTAAQPSGAALLAKQDAGQDAFAPEQAVAHGSGVNEGAGLSLPPDVQQILSDFEKQKLKKEAQSGKKPGKRKGHKRKRKFTAKAKGQAPAPAQPRVVRILKTVQTARYSASGMEVAESELEIATKTRSEAANFTRTEVEERGGKAEADDLLKHGRLMRRSALEAQEKIEASAGGTIALAEVDPFRWSNMEVPRKRAKREVASNPCSIPPATDIEPPQEDPGLSKREAPQPASKYTADQRWRLSTPMYANKCDIMQARFWKASEPSMHTRLVKASETPCVRPNHPSSSRPNPISDRKWEGAEYAVCEGVGETRVNGGAKEADPKNVKPEPETADRATHKVAGGAVRVDGNEADGVNTPGSAHFEANDLETSPKGEVLDVGEGVNGIAMAGLNRLSEATRTVSDDAKRPNRYLDGDGAHVTLKAAVGMNEPSGVNGPEMSRVESESTAALQPQLENGSSGQVSGGRHKLAAKTLVDVGGVARWLEGLGLARLAPLFAEHEVIEDALPQLTSEDLKEMGVKAVGTRRLILNNIELLKQGVVVDAQGHVM